MPLNQRSNQHLIIKYSLILILCKCVFNMCRSVERQIYSNCWSTNLFFLLSPPLFSLSLYQRWKKPADAVNHRLKINQHNTNAVLNALRSLVSWREGNSSFFYQKSSLVTDFFLSSINLSISLRRYMRKTCYMFPGINTNQSILTHYVL